MVIDTPNLPGKEQAHSTFATEVFQKIMTEVLPYMNIFPDTDVTGTEDESLAAQGEGSPTRTRVVWSPERKMETERPRQRKRSP